MAESAQAPQPKRPRYVLHIVLFLLTVLTTSAVGAELATNQSWIIATPLGPALGWADLSKGLPYSLAFLAFLLCHEFGHYFLARKHRVQTSLPYFLPVFLPLAGIQIGTFGAVIRILQVPRTTRQYFDIGIAGPLAGFVVSICLLWYGFANLPEPEWLFEIHPEYQADFGRIPTEAEIINRYGVVNTPDGPVVNPITVVGSTLLYDFFATHVADPALLPPATEIMHYPLLFAGFLTLFFTALNLLPIGQLDGGHVLYGMFGRRRAALISRITVLLLILYGGSGVVVIGSEFWSIWLLCYLLYLTLLTPHIFNTRSIPVVLGSAVAIIAIQQGIQWLFPVILTNGIGYLWLVYAFLAVRVVRLDHPPAVIEQRLDRPRMLLGWLAIVVFILCFTPSPIILKTAAYLSSDPGVEGVLASLVGW